MSDSAENMNDHWLSHDVCYQPQHINSDTTHSDASTVEKKPSVLNGVDGSQTTDDVNDDDEHGCTYPDGIIGGTFDAPAPTSALITAPKTEEVMMTEIVMPDSRQASLPDYYKSQPRTTKPYAFYNRFHSVYRIGKIIGVLFLILVVVRVCTVLVLRVSVDHECFDDEEKSTTAPIKAMTSISVDHEFFDDEEESTTAPIKAMTSNALTHSTPSQTNTTTVATQSTTKLQTIHTDHVNITNPVDVKNCGDGWKCKNGNCVPYDVFCDTEDNCDCGEVGTEFFCGDGYCVHQAWVCDGEADCHTGADESDCVM